VAIAIDGYVAVDVTAVVGKLPCGVDAVIGEDLLKRAVRVGQDDGHARLSKSPSPGSKFHAVR
jgi:hypothetical protein